MLVAVNKSIHKNPNTFNNSPASWTVSSYDPTPLGNNWEWTSRSGPLSLMFKKHTGSFKNEILIAISRVKHQLVEIQELGHVHVHMHRHTHPHTHTHIQSSE